MTIQTIPAERIPELLGNRFLNLIIFPTEKCNLRCSYCYEDFKIGKMSHEIINGVKNLINLRASTLEMLEISWFGGEPLLAKEIIYEISSHVKTLKSKFPKFNYRGNITTNGVFLDLQTAEKLILHDISFFQITLDGDQELHDKTANSKCFEKIWNNLIAFKNSDLGAHIELRVHYSPETWENLDGLIQKINNEFSTDQRFSFYFKSIEHYGGKNDQKTGLFTLESNRLAKSLLEGKLAHTAMIYKVPYASNFICYAAKPTSFGIRANGNIIKCTVALNEDRNLVGNLDESGSMNLNQEKVRLWIDGLRTGDKQMLQCPNSKMRNYQPKNYIKIEPI